MRRTSSHWLLALTLLSPWVVSAPLAPLVILAAPAKDAPGDPSVMHVQAADVGAHQICLITQVFDSDAIATNSYISLLDSEHNQILWQRELAVSDDLDSHVEALSCTAFKEQLWVAADIAPRSVNVRTADVRMYAFDRQGQALANTSASLDEGLSYFLGWLPQTADAQAWLGNQVLEKEENPILNSTFVRGLDAKLQSTPAILNPHGAYNGANYQMRSLGTNAYIVGLFDPAKPLSTDAQDYAASKLDAQGRYLWSTHAKMPKGVLSGATFTVDAQANFYALATKGTDGAQQKNAESFLSAVTPKGQEIALRHWSSEFCSNQSLTASSKQLFAVRKPCEGSEDALSLVAIDPQSLAETEIDQFQGKPQRIQVLGDRLWVAGVTEQGAVVIQQIELPE